MASNIEARAERLLSALAGVVSARALADEFGRLCEIHVLASPELHPKQIVRNVESALSAGLGVVVDRRIVSVAQLRADATEPYISPPRARPGAAPSDAALDRVVYVKFDASSTSALDATCSVTLGRGSERMVGSASGMNTLQGRADTGARAVFDAFQENEGLNLEGTAVVEAQGKTFVFVSARSLAGRNTRLLTGVSALRSSPEEAGIMAALQATNRVPAV